MLPPERRREQIKIGTRRSRRMHEVLEESLYILKLRDLRALFVFFVRCFG